jgi:FixJ family two-component response regulator
MPRAQRLPLSEGMLTKQVMDQPAEIKTVEAHRQHIMEKLAQRRS